MPTFEDLHGKTIGESFAEFDAAFPDVYQQIRRQATVAISRGRSRISIKAIVNWIRWNVFIETDDANSQYRINDAYISLYARKFVVEHPEHEDKIELRRLRASTQQPIKPHDGRLF
jgi:hypothetical protein